MEKTITTNCWGYIRDSGKENGSYKILALHWGHIGIMEKKMTATI